MAAQKRSTPFPVKPLTRRNLLHASAGTLAFSATAANNPAATPKDYETSGFSSAPAGLLLDLSPARWIWFPSARCLANTFMLFRRSLQLAGPPRRATGWISADSRYQLYVNGQRVQWGPAPCDPKFLELDPIDLTALLRAGENVIGAQVLFYGHGDGTSPAGKPGFFFRLEIEGTDGQAEIIASDQSWQVCQPRSWKPGQYKRSFIRALQEEFDARQYPYGWSEASFETTTDWLPAMILDNPADKPPVCSYFENYLYGYHAEREDAGVRRRTIPLLKEHDVPVGKLAESLWLRWRQAPEQYFDFVTPDAFEVERQPAAREAGPGEWELELDGTRTPVLTFELAEQVVGWPFFTIQAAAGTAIEMLVHEAHAVAGPALMNSHWHSWTRFICKPGLNRFETFDFESCRWIQLHIRGPAGRVRIADFGVRRRIFPWPHEPAVKVAEPALQRLVDASVNTLHNCAQDSIVDGMARERQQYSGDCGHQLHAIYLAFGETRLPARYVTTFSQGMTTEGYFLDCWPAFDRMARMMSRSVKLAGWGPILDHGIGFNFDCLHHYLYSGALEAIWEAYPRLRRFVQYLGGIRRPDGLLPVEDIGLPIVWMDHQAYTKQRHKRCAFNLYTAAMLRHAHAPLCRAFGDDAAARAAEAFGESLLSAAVERFWSPDRECFVDNLPWMKEEEGKPRFSDRALATSVLFDQCPGGQIKSAVQALADVPKDMGLSYPANACWRLWALVQAGRTDVVLADLRQRWATMDSVRLNNTLQEDWHVQPDSGHQWSHCAVVPLYILYMSIAGIRPLEPGFARCEIRPQLGDLGQLELTAHTPRGPIHFHCQGPKGNRTVTLTLPQGCSGELLVRNEERVELPKIAGPAPAGHSRYTLPMGQRVTVRLRQT